MRDSEAPRTPTLAVVTFLRSEGDLLVHVVARGGGREGKTATGPEFRRQI